MLRRAFISFLFLSAPLSAQELSTAAMRPVSLPDVYALALGRSEDLARQAEGVAALDAAAAQAGAAFRPAVDLNAALTKEQGRDAASRGYLSGRYNIFSGMRDYVALKAAESRTGAARLDLERARQRLYLSAAQAFLQLLAAQQEVFIRSAQTEVTSRRIAELEARAAIGRSRRSEVVSARSQLAQDRAALLAAMSQERLAQEDLRFVTGLAADLAPREMDLRPRAGLEEYLRLALLRPDVQARKAEADAYGFLAEAQERGAWPTVDLAANYYVLRDPMPAPENRWDAGAYVRVPLYTGGDLRARKDAAYAARRAAGLSLELARRQALSEVRAAYDEYGYAVRQAGSLAEALKLADENAAYQQEDYKMGLVTNLDVLNALNTAQQTRLSLSQAQARLSLALIRLETAAGAELR